MKTIVTCPMLFSLFVLLLMAGCSASYSVDKSSDSISESLDSISASFESFTSISDSSGSGKEEVQAALQRFVDDVSGLTLVYVNRKGTANDFEHQLGALAAGYGIADWEMEPMTFRAIGNGLRQAGLKETGIGNQLFLQSSVMTRGHSLIAEGYRGA